MSITILLIISTILISIQGFNNPHFLSKWAYSPYLQKNNKEHYRIFSHMFVHADTTHLFFNMFALYMFGENMELSLQHTFGLVPGSIHFIILYFAGGFAATIWPFIRNHDNVSYSSVGASGAVSAIVFAMILWYPEMELFLLFIPIPIPGYIFGALYLAFEYYMSKSKTSRIAHDAHFGGAIFGIIYILIINIDKGKELLDLIF